MMFNNNSYLFIIGERNLLLLVSSGFTVAGYVVFTVYSLNLVTGNRYFTYIFFYR